MSLWSELKRRNVIRMAVLYVVAAWLLLQVADVGMSVLELPVWTGKLIFLLLALGFPLVLIFSWLYELTPEGIKRESLVDRSESITPDTGRKLNILTSVLVVIGLVALGLDRLLPEKTPEPSAGTPAQSVEPAPVRQAAPREEASAHDPEPTDHASPQSVAVLPFVNMSDDKENEYFADGLAEEVLNLLAGIEGLNVAARTSSFTFKNTNLKLPDIARELNVGTVLEGSVRRAGNKVRVTAQLIKAHDGYHLWSETYDRELDDVFAIQSDIAAHVAEAMEATLLGGEDVVEKQGTSSPEAYDAYLRGLYLANQGSSDEIWQAAHEAFRAATELDPDFAPAWAGLGYALERLIGNGVMQPVEGWPRVREALARAEALDPDLPETLVLRANVAESVDYQWDEALELSRRAVELRPGDAGLLRHLSSIAARLGFADEAVRAVTRAVELDPLNMVTATRLTATYAEVRQFDNCLAAARRAYEMDSQHAGARAMLAWCQLKLGDPGAALGTIEGVPLTWGPLLVQAIANARLGRMEASRAAYGEMERRYGDAAAYQLAGINAEWGNADAAFAWLDRAMEARDPGMSYVLGDDFMDPLRGDPRFRAVLERVGLAGFPRPDFVPAAGGS
jgi:TolB-like protein/Flp pilus assembly protein TadD